MSWANQCYARLRQCSLVDLSIGIMLLNANRTAYEGFQQERDLTEIAVTTGLSIPLAGTIIFTIPFWAIPLGMHLAMGGKMPVVPSLYGVLWD
jgi:hypothetical protein